MDKGALMQLNDSKNNIASRARRFAAIYAALALGLAFGSRPAAAAPFAYVTNIGSNNVSVIDTASNTVVATVPVGFNPRGADVTPDGARVYVTNAGDNTVSGYCHGQQHGGVHGRGGVSTQRGRRHPGRDTRLCVE